MKIVRLNSIINNKSSSASYKLIRYLNWYQFVNEDQLEFSLGLDREFIDNVINISDHNFNFGFPSIYESHEQLDLEMKPIEDYSVSTLLQWEKAVVDGDSSNEKIESKQMEIDYDSLSDEDWIKRVYSYDDEIDYEVEYDEYDTGNMKSDYVN